MSVQDTPIASFAFGQFTGTTSTVSIPLEGRDHNRRTLVLINNTDQSFTNLSLSANDTSLPSVAQAGASDSNSINGTLTAGYMAILHDTIHDVIATSLNELVLSVQYTAVPTKGSLDVYVIES